MRTKKKTPKIIQISELKPRLAKYIDWVYNDFNSIIVVRRDKIVAKIIPYSDCQFYDDIEKGKINE